MIEDIISQYGATIHTAEDLTSAIKQHIRDSMPKKRFVIDAHIDEKVSELHNCEIRRQGINLAIEDIEKGLGC